MLFSDTFFKGYIYFKLKHLGSGSCQSLPNFYFLQDCESTKAVFLISSVIHDITEQVLKDIISGSNLTDISLICGAHPSVQGYAKYPLAEDVDDKQIVADLEMKIIEWIGKPVSLIGLGIFLTS